MSLKRFAALANVKDFQVEIIFRITIYLLTLLQQKKYQHLNHVLQEQDTELIVHFSKQAVVIGAQPTAAQTDLKKF